MASSRLGETPPCDCAGGHDNPHIIADLHSVLKPTPSISGVEPSSIFAGADSAKLGVKGENFIQQSKVRWNGYDRHTEFLGKTLLIAELDGDDIAHENKAIITVFNPRSVARATQMR